MTWVSHTLPIGEGVVYAVGCLALCYAVIQQCITRRITLVSHGYQSRSTNEGTPLVRNPTIEAESARIMNNHSLIKRGLEDHFRSEYGLCLSFTAFFALIIFSIMAWSYESGYIAVIMAIAYLIGSIFTLTVSFIAIYESLYCGVRTGKNKLVNSLLYIT